jgi:hypothetical protein
MSHRAITKSSACLLAGLLALPNPAAAAELKPGAARGFEQYVQMNERRIEAELQPGGTFLWVDTFSMERLRRGQVVTERREHLEAGRAISTPGALIHHWVGTVLIPGATLRQVLGTIQDYDRHQQYYSPEVVKSQTLEHSGDEFSIYLRLKRVKVVTAVFDTEHQVRYHYLDSTRAYSESRSSRIAEMKDPREAGERAFPAGEDRGFLWRLNSYWRFHETGEGVYVQCEAISLTREIPAGLGWLIGRFVESIPRESLDFTLKSTRTAVLDDINETNRGTKSPEKGRS